MKLSRPLRFEPLETRRLLATVNVLHDVSVADTETTLREAILAASPGEAINFSAALFDTGPGTIQLTNVGHVGEIAITKALSIHGPGAGVLTIRAFAGTAAAGDGARIFNINNGVDASLIDVEISGLTLTGGDTSLNRGGGAIFSRENLRVTDSVIIGNRAVDDPATVSGSGGGISLSVGNLFVANCTIKDNVAGESGGGIFTLGANVTVIDSTISGNIALGTSGYGGGLYCQEELTITRSTIVGNSAGRGGAGISNRSGNTSITGSTISRNKPTVYGGGFLANGGNSGQTTLVDTIITGNEAKIGGGIYNFNQNLTVIGCTIDNNHADTAGGGIYTPGPVTITRSRIFENSADDGGGILSNGDVTITDTTIHRNFALFGAGISHNTGNLTVVRSTFSANDANQGGGILSETTAGHKTSILNSTFSDNNASAVGGAILNNFGVVEIRHSTITAPNIQFNSGGGVMTRSGSGTQTIVFSSIIDNNVGPDVQFFGGATNPFVSQGYNIVGSGNAATGIVNTFFQVGDMVGADSLLSSMLAENGGPTKTHLLRPGSPAIEHGPPANMPGLPATDQRGFPFVRAFNHDGTGGTQLDIGAVELQTVANLSLVVDTLIDESDGNLTAGHLSLREAIGLANGSEGANSIAISPALTSGGPATILLTRGELQVVDPLTLPGPGAHLLTIDASGNDHSPDEFDQQGTRVFNVDSGVLIANQFLFTLSGFTLTGADYEADGGAIRNEKTLVLNDCVITGNSAVNGGGIYVDAGTVTLNNTTVAGNHAFERGGGMLIEDGKAIVNGSTFRNNTADSTGGGIYNEEMLVVNSSTISGNSATLGAGIYSRTNFLNDYSTVINSTISGNTAMNRGGGLYNFRGITTIRFSTITDNDAPAGMGSGVASHGDSDTRTEVTSTIIAGNDHSDADFVNGGANSFDSEGYNLVGTGNSTQSPLNAFNQTGDLVGVNALLGPLSDNGGPTKTHALLALSPAINAGNPAAVANVSGVPAFDQRGVAFSRVSNGRIDIGAVERQAIPLAVFGDYNHNNIVDAADYTVWRNSLGQTGVTPYTGADGDGDGMITQLDYQVWKSHYGQAVPAVGATVNEPLLMQGTQDTLARVIEERTSIHSAVSVGAAIEVVAKGDSLNAVAVPSLIPRATIQAGIRNDFVQSRRLIARETALLAWLELCGSHQFSTRREDFAVTSAGGDPNESADCVAFDQAFAGLSVAF